MPKVRLYNIFRNRVGKPELDVPAEEAGTVGQLLDALDGRAPGFRKLVLGDEGDRPRSGVAVMVNGRTIVAPDPLSTPISPDDVVTFVPAISGG